MSSEAIHQTHSYTTHTHTLTGSSSNHVFLWKHGERNSRATYLPLLESAAAKLHAKHNQLLPDLVVVSEYEWAREGTGDTYRIHTFIQYGCM